MPTTYTKIIKDNPRDRLEVEIGDSKQADFYPQLKIKRWDNEVNASFRLLGDTGTHSKQGDVVKYVNDKRETHFYELPVSTEHPEGASEIEIILKKKPATNKIEFSMQTKGLEFLYQPQLTQKEKDEGAKQPDNVIGSYAVYYKDCPTNYVDGKIYRNGKAFHIYRPRIEDANGDWIWGKLQIKNKKLTVTIPQEFLDNAVYPIKHAAGLTFGFETIGADSNGFDNYIMGTVYTMGGTAGTADSISVYGSTTGTQDKWRGTIYLDSDNSLIDYTAEHIHTSNPDWETENLTQSGSLSASIDYKLGIWIIGMTFYYDTGVTGFYNSHTYHQSDPPVDPLVPTAWANHKLSIYVTYTAASSDVTVEPSALALTATLETPSLATDDSFSPAPLALTTTLHAPTVVAPQNITITPDTLALTATLLKINIKNTYIICSSTGPDVLDFFVDGVKIGTLTSA